MGGPISRHREGSPPHRRQVLFVRIRPRVRLPAQKDHEEGPPASWEAYGAGRAHPQGLRRQGRTQASSQERPPRPLHRRQGIRDILLDGVGRRPAVLHRPRGGLRPQLEDPGVLLPVPPGVPKPDLRFRRALLAQLHLRDAPRRSRLPREGERGPCRGGLTQAFDSELPPQLRRRARQHHFRRD